MSKIKSLFLGPQAENLDFFEKIISDIIRDNGFLRRNYQVDDELIINEQDKLTDDYINSITEFQNHLKITLNQLKKSVPTYHPRHIGHMNADVMMSGVAGFMSAMLYNPNNIINIASPASTIMEIEYIDALCKMVGFPGFARTNRDSGAWGHLCSGGTSANIEALWVLRNLKYFPVSLKITANQTFNNEKICSFINELVIDGKSVEDHSFNSLLQVNVNIIYGLMNKVLLSISKHLKNESENKISDAVIRFYDEYILPFTVQKSGIAGIHQNCIELGETLKQPVVYISRTCHYSWEKAMDIVGLGRNNLIKIAVDNDFRINTDELFAHINSSENTNLAVIDIMGTTEEGAIDDLGKIIKQRAQRNYSYFIHVDGAYGGYFATMIDMNGNVKPSDFNFNFKTFLNEIIDDEKINIDKETVSKIIKKYFAFDDNWYSKVEALKHIDSITIDPHKLGYIPYPAGAVLFKDSRSRDLISFYAPYVTNENSQDISAIYLGQWTLEGSRPGSSAVACYLSSKVLPLNVDGYGKLLGCTVIGAVRLLSSIEKFNSDNKLNRGYQVIPLFKSDSNVVCYIIANPKYIKSPKLLNIFTDAVFKTFAIDAHRIIPDYNFILSNSLWDYEKYQPQIDTILRHAGIDEIRFSEMQGEKLEYIRSVMMNPLSAFVSGIFYDDYMKQISLIADKALSKAFLHLINEKNKGERLDILWIENEVEIKELKNIFEQDELMGKYFNFDFCVFPNTESIDSILQKREYFATIIDLNLLNKDHHKIENKESGYEVLRKVKELNFNNIIVYSAYLREAHPSRNLIFNEMNRDLDIGFLLPEQCLLGKSDDLDRDRLAIIHAIFEMLQSK